MKTLPNKFLFMKVGNHANESWEQILIRKRKEFDRAGKIFWGYGGSACHPLKQVQPFCKLVVEEQETITLIMQPINSNADQTYATAQEYSEDGKIWKPIPKGIKVTGSKYALVLDEIKEGDLDLALTEFEVGIGPSIGKAAERYLSGRTDKGCFVRSKELRAPVVGRDIRKVNLFAQLQKPFGVVLR